MKESGDIGIELIIDNNDTGIDPTYLSFVYTESIHNILPFMTIDYRDTIGIAQEYLNFCEGREFKIKLQDLKFEEEGDIKTFDMVVDKEDRNFTNDVGNVMVSTDNKVYAKHIFYNNDDIKSTSYEDNTSGILDTILTNYNYKFDKINISNTNDSKIFYNPLKNDLDFIDDILIKNAYHISETPMFCYIDSFNEFNYKSYQDMYNSRDIAELKDVSTETNDFETRDVIEDFKIIELGSEKLKKFRSRNYIYFSNDGDIVEDEFDIIKLLPKSKDNVLPIVKHSDLNTSYYYMDDIGYDDTEENNVRGRFIYENRDVFFLQRLQIRTTYNYFYGAGKKIKLKLHMGSGDKPEESLYYRGNYIIEVNSIVWDNVNKQMSNVMIISRCNFNIEDDINIKNKLYK